MRDADFQQPANFLSAESPARRGRGRIEGSESLQRVRGEISALDAPVTECTQGFGVICEGLACPSLALEVSQFLLYSRQDAIQVSKGMSPSLSCHHPSRL